MGERDSEQPLPDHVDPELWFTTERGERLYLVGNPHTFPGRMWAYNPTTENYLAVSKSKIHDAPSTTRYWVRGYLSGNEPDSPPGDDGYPVDDREDPRYAAWVEALKLFADTGYWWVGDPRSCERCSAELLPSDFGDPRCPACPDRSEGN